MRLFALTLSFALATTAAHASSDDAWAELDHAVTEACAVSSGLESARVSEPVLFDDTLNKVAALVTGIYSQPHMKMAEGAVLCIYDKLTQRTWIDEAPGWIAPNMG